MKVIKKLFDREKILRLVNKQNWEQLLDEFRNNENYDLITADVVLKTFLDQYFINEILTKTSLKSDPAYKYYLEQFSALHIAENFNFKLKDDDYKKLIVKIVEVEEILDYAYKYALKFPDEEICKQVIKQFQDAQPKVVRHSQEDILTVIENKNIRDVDARIGLFKSRQEYQFYRSVIEVFPNYLVIPNVALSAIIDFEQIKGDLNQEEKNYFFKSLIDCAVIDTENNFVAIKLFELDSDYHDTEKQQMKDKQKDNILAIAGQKLIRIRQTSKKQNQEGFTKLIREKLK